MILSEFNDSILSLELPAYDSRLACFMNEQQYKDYAMNNGHTYYAYLAKIVRYLNPQKVVELGTSDGCSAAFMLTQLSESAELITLDVDTSFPKYLSGFEKDRRLKIMKGSSLDPVFYMGLDSIDMLFIDTEHTYKQVSAEWNIYKHRLSNNAIIVFDDIDLNDDMRKFWNEVTEEKLSLGSNVHASGFGIVRLTNNKKIGAQYVVYEDSGFLSESVSRIYPLMNKIVFLVGLAPWNGVANSEIVTQTLTTIMNIPDPEKKFIICAKKWPNEHTTRNEGLDILQREGCQWCLIIDDDEMYNREELKRAIQLVFEWQCTNGVVSSWAANHQIYWKDRQTIIDNFVAYLAAFVSTDADSVRFYNARLVVLSAKSVWMNFSLDDLTVHHMSYVRSNEKMWNKINTFSHAREGNNEAWFNNKWLAWTSELENLHPNPGNPSSFKRAVPLAATHKQLEVMQVIDPNYIHNQTIKYLSHESEVPLWVSGAERFLDTFVLPNATNIKFMNFLDAGCGDGLVLSYFKARGHIALTGIDLSADKLARAEQSGCLLLREDLHTLSLPDKVYNMIYCSHVLEHCHDPVIAWKELKRVATCDAIFFVVLPYVDVGPSDAHCGSSILGTRIKDGGATVINWFKGQGMVIDKVQLDNYREDEIWLSMRMETK